MTSAKETQRRTHGQNSNCKVRKESELEGGGAAIKHHTILWIIITFQSRRLSDWALYFELFLHRACFGVYETIGFECSFECGTTTLQLTFLLT